MRRIAVVSFLAVIGLIIGGCVCCLRMPIAEFSWTPSDIWAGVNSVTFDAIGPNPDAPWSYDPDGHIVSFSWLFTKDGKTAHTSLEKRFVFTFPESGDYNVSLTVTDNSGKTATVQKTVYAKNPAPEITGIEIRNVCRSCRRIEICDLVELKASGLDLAALLPMAIMPMAIVRYEWDLNYDGNFEVEATGNPVTRRYNKCGQYTIAVRAIDDHGAVSPVSTKTFCVFCKDRDPIAAISGAPTTVKVGTKVTLNGSGSYDRDVCCSSYCDSPCNLCADSVSADLLASMAFGSSGCGGCPPPPCDPPCPSPDPCGSCCESDKIASYTWYFSNKTLTGSIVSYTFTQTGSFPITLKVRDHEGNTATDSVTIEVTD